MRVIPPSTLWSAPDMTTTSWRCQAQKSNLRSSRLGNNCPQVRVVHCQGWPHSAGALHKVFNAVSIVQAWHLEYQNGPLVLVDRWKLKYQTMNSGHQIKSPNSKHHLYTLNRTGGTEAATFAALTTLKKQMDREQAVDVYQVIPNSKVEIKTVEDCLFKIVWWFSVWQVCKLLHNKRPGVWRGQEDYLYIHKVGTNTLLPCVSVIDVIIYLPPSMS